MSTQRQIRFKSFSDKPIIISGFPGIGKSHAMELNDGYNGIYIADSDSSKFAKSDFPANYIEHIKEYMKTGFALLFISTHKEVREALIKEGIPFILVYPNIKLRGEYIQRYTNRDSPEAFLKLLFDNWHNWISELMNQDCDKIELQAGQYLTDILKEETKTTTP